MNTLTQAQLAFLTPHSRSAGDVVLDGFEDEGARFHVTYDDGSRFGVVIDPDGELVTSTPINAAGEPIDLDA